MKIGATLISKMYSKLSKIGVPSLEARLPSLPRNFRKFSIFSYKSYFLLSHGTKCS